MGKAATSAFTRVFDALWRRAHVDFIAGKGIARARFALPILRRRQEKGPPTGGPFYF
jgi:hypothetical protein